MSNAETTLCTAIEAGPLEAQVLLLAESLRQFGGRYAALPFVAVRPRAGPRIAAATRRALARLDVTLVERNISTGYAWWAMMNKPATLVHVEETARTPNVTWMDGDMMVLREPRGFAPPEEFDFIGRSGEAADVASNGDDGRQEFWHRLCDRLGIDFDAFPMIESFPEAKPIRAYWQGGLFTYRRATRFGDGFRHVYETMLDGDIASKLAGTYHTDQVALALSVQKLGLRTAHYDPRMNFNVNPLAKETSLMIPIGEVEIMHYHGSLWPADYGWTRTVVAPLAADRRDLLGRYAPLGNEGFVSKAHRKLYSTARRRRIAAYEARVQRY